jgi:hypothetical protein
MGPIPVTGMPADTVTNPQRRNWSKPAVWLLAASAGLFVGLPGISGEPIRFVRPKADEKAPLRVNYSAEAAQAKEKRALGLPEESSGARLSQTISINRRARETTRKKWSTETEASDNAAARARMDLQRWRMSRMEEDNPSRAGGAGLFGLGENREAFSAGNAAPGPEIESPSRTLTDFGLRGMNEPRSAAGANGFSPWSWNAQPSPSGSSLRPEGPSSPSSLSPAPGPRFETENPGFRNPPSSPPISPYTPRNFELPGRPR